MNVCSKCAGSRVCECEGGNGNGVTMGSAGWRKQQQQHSKIPKRGPGVAELEKILREQGTSDLPATQRGNNEGFSISLSWPCPNSTVFDSHVPSLPPAIGSMYGNGMNSSLGWNGGGESSERERFHMNHTNESVSLIPQFNDTKECYSDANWGSTLELNSVDNVGTAHANFPQVVVSEVPPAAMPLSPTVHTDGKPFFNFLKLKDQDEVADAGSSNNGIDLTLKL
ncbi:hypothetical protein KIW84_015348 [Lathyrus oleraceus]|uniref:Uncharacterized protein n=1 Tax=Pisum sativum TaxID=3888 RepID=A0A9D5BQA9_PEA|nr:hypothetical protein KIW84_015348 [Pisum sativum]